MSMSADGTIEEGSTDSMRKGKGEGLPICKDTVCHFSGTTRPPLNATDAQMHAVTHLPLNTLRRACSSCISSLGFRVWGLGFSTHLKASLL